MVIKNNNIVKYEHVKLIQSAIQNYSMMTGVNNSSVCRLF